MAFGTNPLTGRPGPCPMAPRDDDRVQARQRINVEVQAGRRPHPNELPCVDCGHIWKPGERRHEYDHYLGYSAAHHYDVQSVCTKCHAKRTNGVISKCIRGHEFTPDNTIIKKNGCRSCRECARLHEKMRGSRGSEFWKRVNAKRKATNGN